MILRVVLLALPAATLLIAHILGGAAEPMTAKRQVVLAAVLIATVPIFMLARFGNESFERVTVDDFAVTAKLYEVAPDDSAVYLRERPAPTQWQRVGEIRFYSLTTLHAKSVARTLQRDEPAGKVFVLLNEAQDQAGVQLDGRKPGWTVRFAQRLMRTDVFVQTDRRGNAFLLELRN